MVYFLYNLLLFFVSPFYLLWVIWKNGGWEERLGIRIPKVEKKVIWIHAVSVGEVVASAPLVSLIKEKLPNYEILLSTVTKTGRIMARKILGKDTYLFYFPFDIPFVMKRVLKKISPKMIVLMEAELWPNLLRYAEFLNIPVIITNGRISPSSFKGYIKRHFFKPIINKISMFCMQTEEDRKKLIELGVFPDKVRKTGNMKFDCYKDELNKVAPEWKIKGREPIIVGGSTHPGEEKILLESFRGIEKKFPYAILIIVPRHPERAPEIEALIKEKGYSYIKRSEIRSLEMKEKIILVDTIGELLQLYRLADVVFVGGSLVPKGGHSPLEPASFAKAIIIGPHTFNFEEIMGLLKKNTGILQIEDPKHLEEAMLKLLLNPEEKQKLGKNAKEVVLSNRGATEKNLRVIEELLKVDPH